MMFSEEEILAVAKDHHYTTGDQGEMHGLCSCRYYRKHAVAYTTDHLIDMLKENLHGRQAAKCENSGFGREGLASSS